MSMSVWPVRMDMCSRGHARRCACTPWPLLQRLCQAMLDSGGARRPDTVATCGNPVL